MSMTRWRDEPLVPRDYEDIASLVKVAREARDRIVEFDWVFSPDDLQQLRRAVFEWGSPVKGRYRSFDARVLAAINTALGDANSMLALSEPPNSASMDGKASCVGDGDLFHLCGHASFDIIFGYGSAGVGRNVYLGASAQETLANAVGLLDWDVRRLQEQRFQPVRNALYGLPLDYGPAVAVSAHGPAQSVAVEFHGPFSALDEGPPRCLFTNEMALRSGVYLWTIEVDGQERPWYVGQTRRTFGERIGEHLACFLSGQYPIYDPVALSKGEHALANNVVNGTWPQTLPSFLRNHETLTPSIAGLIRLMKFHFAPLVGDAHLHDRIEGAIGRYYKAHPNPELRNFLMQGLKLPAAVPYDTPMCLMLSSEAPIAGLPSEIREPPAGPAGGVVAVPLPEDIRHFVESTSWTFAKTYAATWPHEYVVRNSENAPMILALARHIFRHGQDGRFYSQVRKYHHESGKVYWSMDSTPESTVLVNRCEEAQTYEARLMAGTLPRG